MRALKIKRDNADFADYKRTRTSGNSFYRGAESALSRTNTRARARLSDFMTTIEPAATFKKSCLSFAATAVSLVRRTVILTKKNTCK